MSKRNSQEAKRAARERLRIEREKQAKRERIRRQLTVAGSIVGVLAIATGIGVAATQMGGDDKEVNDAGKAVTVGGAKAKKAKRTIDVYEDLRCPACASFEQAIGEQLKKGAEEGKYKLRIHLGAIIDGGHGGSGSQNAIQALGAAKAVSQKAFNEYHTALYSPQFHPKESDDKFADNDYLLQVANEVDELKDNKKFEKNVKSEKYAKWADDMIGSFNGSGVQSTPTIRIDGEDVSQEDLPGQLEDLGVDLKAKPEQEQGGDKGDKEEKEDKGGKDGEDEKADKENKEDKGKEEDHEGHEGH